ILVSAISFLHSYSRSVRACAKQSEVGPLMLGLSVANRPTGSKVDEKNQYREKSRGPDTKSATIGRALSFSQPQRGTQGRDFAREFDLHRLPRLQVPQGIRQAAKFGCLDATQAQQPIACSDPRLLGA